jgi:hypothetical protein
MWLQMLTAEIDLLQPHPTPLLTDNESILTLTKDPRFHARAKHRALYCYEHGLSAAKDALNHEPTGTHRSHSRM